MRLLRGLEASGEMLELGTHVRRQDWLPWHTFQETRRCQCDRPVLLIYQMPVLGRKMGCQPQLGLGNSRTNCFLTPPHVKIRIQGQKIHQDKR
jgi:hypothetical protein